MKAFDLHLDASAADRNTFDNLTFFGMSGALVLPPRLPQRAPARVIARALEVHASACDARARQTGMRLLAAGALRLDSQSPRVLDEAIDALARMLAAEQIAVVAPVDVHRPDALADAHLALAAELRVPLLFYAGPASSPTVVARALKRAIALGIEPRRIAVGGIDHLAIRPVLDAGALGVLGVGSGALGPRDVLDVVARFDDAAWPHLALGSAVHGGGATDVLSLPRAAEALAGADLPTSAAAAVTWRNAHRWLGLPASPAAIELNELR